MTWWLRQGGPGGSVTGPHDEEALKRKIAANAVNSMDEVSADGAKWVRVRRTPLWQPMAAPKPRGGGAAGLAARLKRPWEDGQGEGDGIREAAPANEWGQGAGRAEEGVPVGFWEAWKRGWTRWSWAGRASRSEYWWRMVSMWVEFTMLGVIDGVLFGNAAFTPLTWVYLVALFVPRQGVLVRRLHDIGKSGWWWFFGFVPVAGPILLLVWACTGGDAGPNEYGEVPLMGAKRRQRGGGAA